MRLGRNNVMIVYDLICQCGLISEGWFHDRQEYADQHAAGLLTCPHCDGNMVHKVLSPVSVRTASSPPAKENQTDDPGTTPVVGRADFLRALRSHVEKNFEDVGVALAAEALKMHYGVSESRNIRGVVTEREDRLLQKEGIELIRIMLPSKDGTAN